MTVIATIQDLNNRIWDCLYILIREDCSATKLQNYNNDTVFEVIDEGHVSIRHKNVSKPPSISHCITFS